MEFKKKPVSSMPIFPKNITQYRNVNESSAYLPYIFLKPASDRKRDLIIVAEQQNSSAKE